MSKNILVTYASHAGSTAEIAEVISKTLSHAGAHVELLPLRDVKSISRYSAVVIGSPVRKSKSSPPDISSVIHTLNVEKRFRVSSSL